MEKIRFLKKLIIKKRLDGYIVPKNDEFFNEYVPNNKDRLKYLTNFSGSFGIALILRNKNYLFVDGRYTLQANIQCGKNFKILTIPNKLPADVLNKKLNIGFDPSLHTKKNLNFFFNRAKCNLIYVKENLIDKLWNNSKKEVLNNFYILPKKAIGHSYKFKFKKLTKFYKKKGVDFHFITAAENVAWILNIRGRDSEYSPLPNAYVVIDKKKGVYFFCNLKKINKAFRKKFSNIKFNDIKFIENFLTSVKNKKALIDSNSCSVSFENILKKNNSIVCTTDPIYNLKSFKTKKEIHNTIISHFCDGAALTKFLFWVKNNYLKNNITEISAQNKLLNFRKKNKNFKFLSFPTISGSGPNGSIIHYKATKKTNRKLRKGDIYLVDSGGQYNFGTTDVTRTISLSNNNQRIKDIFTSVLKSHIAVASYKLNKKTLGSQIDSVARKPLRKLDLDYAHGTGHGVGYFLNVHEGPHAISKKNKIKFKEGVIISNEPGYYENNSFGIRIENLIRVKKIKNRIFFDNLTMAPIDKSLINKNILKENEILWLNNYHKKVFASLKNFMTKSELIELKQA